MMPSRLAFCLVFLLSFASVALAEEQTCTAGRLFLSDSVQAAIHVYDLDGTAGPQFVSSLASAAPAMSLYSSETFSARVAAVFAGNATTGYLGRVQLFRSGITTESHGDHSDIVKYAPGRYRWEFSGYKPSHFTASAGYLSVFSDGVYSSSEDGSRPSDYQSSSAEFVLESVFTEDSLNVQPTTTRLEVPAHHGVAYAMAAGVYIVSQPTEARRNYASTVSTPNGFSVVNGAGDQIVNLDDRTNESRNCSSAHGSASIGNTYAFGCSSVGVLMVSYNASMPAGASRITSKKVSYPSPAGFSFRSSTLYSQSVNQLFVGNFIDSAGTISPSYSLQFPSTVESLTSSNLIETATTSARFCAFAVDKGTPETAGVSNVAYLAVDGKLYATQVDAAGVVQGDAHSVQFSSESTITCANYGLIGGYGTMYIINKVSGLLFTINMEALIEDDEVDHIVSSILLPFRPSGGVVSLPAGFDCGASHDHHHEDGSTGAAGSTGTGAASTIEVPFTAIAIIMAATLAIMKRAL